MARGEDTGNHPNRKVHEERFAASGMDYAADQGYYDDDRPGDGLHREMETRRRLEDEYGGGAGDWDH